LALLSPWLLKESARWFDWPLIGLILGGSILFFLDDLTLSGFWGNILALMTRSLLDDAIPALERAEWKTYLQKRQQDDGLFRDSVILDQVWHVGAPLWCGRPHLAGHVLICDRLRPCGEIIMPVST